MSTLIIFVDAHLNNLDLHNQPNQLKSLPMDLLHLKEEVDIEILTSVLFDNVDIHPENPQSVEYPEALLQTTDNANKYYNGFQRYTRQFIETDTGGVVRWHDSKLEATERQIVESWLGTEVNKRTTQDKKQPSAAISKANKLFKWSSGDAYIFARKHELKMKKGAIELNGVDVSTEANSETNKSQGSDNKSAIKIQVPGESVTNNLNRAIEIESNNFIHARIQKIKAHHSEAIEKQIHERKKVDHELHLQRLRLKEEEYERAMEASLAAQQKQPGFLGSLFGFAASTPQQNLTQHPDTSSLALDSTPQTASSTNTNKSKRFSFLPTFGKSDAPLKQDLPSTDAVDEIEKGDNEEEVTESKRSPDKSAEPKVSLDEIEAKSKISQEKVATSPKINKENENVSLTNKANKGTTSTVEDTSDDYFDDFESSVQPSVPPTNNDPFGELSMFDTSTSIQQPNMATKPKESKLKHEFLSFDNHKPTSSTSSQNMAELMDIFGTPSPTQPSKSTPKDIDVDNLLDF